MLWIHRNNSSFFTLAVSTTAIALCFAVSVGSTGSGMVDAMNAPHDVDEIYDNLGVKRPDNRNRVWKIFGQELPLSRWSWKIHGRLLPLLHLFDDQPRDVFVNLRVLWCKLLASLDPESPVYEGPIPNCSESTTNIELNRSENAIDQDCCLFATYKMLPPYSIKWALRYLGLWRFFPRWMHANIELRTAFLKRALKSLLSNASTVATDNPVKTWVIVLGGGYDSRGVMLSCDRRVGRVYELDLPVVVRAKKRMLERGRFEAFDQDVNGDKSYRTSNGVRLIGVDLNEDEQVDRVLDTIRDELFVEVSQQLHDGEGARADNSSQHNWHIIIIAEAVLMYLETGKAERLLEGMAKRFSETNVDDLHVQASFVFADRLIRQNKNNRNSVTETTASRARAEASQMNDDDRIKVQQWLWERGWRLQELLFKPGATRHLGIAKIK